MKREEALQYLKTAKGQVEAVIKMVEDGKYCIDISKQILASISLLKKANVKMLNAHLGSCVKNAIDSKNREDVDTKIKELGEIIEYLSKVI
ncbi:metal-sensing transcriptional repressor [Deferribacter thermophilus]|uniref:metal-sensing transcriptional repressor n=1 Tax=Deferribacter thermophilus TaxID=53573 RepID=UPI003C206F2B